MLHNIDEEDILVTIQSVTRIIARKPELVCAKNSDFFRDLGLTSLNMIMLMTEVCEQLNFNIFNYSESDLAEVNTIHDLISLFKKKE